jgi:hypothetical protein
MGARASTVLSRGDGKIRLFPVHHLISFDNHNKPVVDRALIGVVHTLNGWVYTIGPITGQTSNNAILSLIYLLENNNPWINM